MKTPTDLERLRDEAAAQRLKELTPYMSDKERQRLIDEGRSETYTSVQIGFNTAVEIMSERLTLAEQDRDSWKRSFVEARDAAADAYESESYIEMPGEGAQAFRAGWDARDKLTEPDAQALAPFDEQAAKCEAYAIVPVGVSMLKTENEDLGKQIINACVALARWQWNKLAERVRKLETEADDAWASLKKATDEITRLRAALERIETEDNGWAGFEAGKALSGGGEK